MTATLFKVGSGYDSVSSSVSVPYFIAPAGVDKSMGVIVALVWAASSTGEVPPTVTPLGSGWSTVVAPRTTQNMGWAVFQRAAGYTDAGDVLAFQMGAGRVTGGLDAYTVNAGTIAPGAITERGVSGATTTAAALTTTEASELVLAISAERTAAITGAPSASGATQLGFIEGAGTGANSVWIGNVTAPASAGNTSAATITYGAASINGGALQLAIPTATSTLFPNDEQVGVAWLKTIPYLANGVATSLPDPSSWPAPGFVTVIGAGGDPNPDLPISEPVISVSTYAVASNGAKPPWNQAAQLAEQIKRATWDHWPGSATQLGRAKLTMPSGYYSAFMHQVRCLTEPRRVEDDVAAYARYQMDLELRWTLGP